LSKYNTYINEYSYSGDLITSAAELDDNGYEYKEFYEYDNGKIISRQVYSGGDLVQDEYFTYPNNNVIRGQGNSGTSSDYGLAYLDSNENIVKIEGYVNNQLVDTNIFTFDNKNNPFINVKGFNFLISISSSIGYYPGGKNNQLSRQNGAYRYEYTYDEQNFPISLKSFSSNNILGMNLIFVY
jgi:hypothetical protein